MLKAQLDEIAKNNAFAEKLHKKHHPSVLFSPKEASDTELETIYAIGLNGLRSLISTDTRFARYQKTLFSQESKSFDRSMKTKDENKKIDKEIKGFFSHLQPYMLLNASLKCIEWLLRRFQVHVYNSSDLLLCALPYCDENDLFQKIIKINNLQYGKEFEFLQKYARMDLPLQKSVLISEAIKIKSLVWAIAKYFQEYVAKSEKYPLLIKIRSGLFVSIMIPFLQSVKVDENILLKLLPIVLECLKVQKSEEIHIVAYLMIVTICDKVQLSDKVCQVLCNSVIMTAYSPNEMCMCLVKIYQSQENAPKLSASIVQTLFKQGDEFTRAISELSKRVDCKNFINALFQGLFEGNADFLPYLQSLINAITLDKLMIEMICSRLSETRDEAVKKSPIALKLLQDLGFIPEATSSIDFKSSESVVSTDMFLHLQSPMPQHRTQAAKHLFTALNAMENLPVAEELDSLKSMVSLCLDDDCADVLSEALECKHLKLLVSEEVLIKKIGRIMAEISTLTLLAGKKLIDLMMTPSNIDALEFLVAHLYQSKESSQVDKELAQYFCQKFSTDKKISGLNEAIVKILNFKLYNAFWSRHLLDVGGRGRNMAIAYSIAANPDSLDELERMTEVLDCNQFKDIKSKGVVSSAIKDFMDCQAEKADLAILSWISLGLRKHMSGLNFIDVPDRIVNILHRIYSKLIVDSSNLPVLVDWLMELSGQSGQQIVQLLALIWLSDSSERACQIALKLSVKFVANDHFADYPFLVIGALQSAYPTVRLMALDCLKVVPGKDVMQTFINFLVECRAEFEGDKEFVEKCLLRFYKLDKSVKQSFIVSFANAIRRYSNAQLRCKLYAFIRSDSKSISALSDILVGYLIQLRTKPLPKRQFDFMLKMCESFTPKSLRHLDQNGKSAFFTALDVLESPANWLDELPTVIYNQISQPNFYQSLPDDSMRDELVKRLFRLSSSLRAHNSTPRQIILSLPLGYQIFQDQISDLLELLQEYSVEKTGGKREKKSSDDQGSKQFVSLLFSLDPILEVLKVKREVEDRFQLVTIMFETLSCLVSIDPNGSVGSTNYSMQLILSVTDDLIKNCSADQYKQWDESMIRVDTLVECIRSTTSSETRNHALNLLSSLSQPFPDKVISHIIFIFTFMGTNILQKDDASTFQTTENLIRKVVPLMSVGGMQKQDDVIEYSSNIIQVLIVFVEAFFHIPEHRRLHLFVVLAHAVGAEEYLALISLLLFSRGNKKSYQSKNSSAGSNAMKFLMDFVVIFFRKFRLTLRMKALTQMSQVVTMLSDPDNLRAIPTIEPEIFQFLELKDAKQKLFFRAVIVDFLSHFCSSPNGWGLLRDEQQQTIDIVPFMEVTIAAVYKINESGYNGPVNQVLVDALCGCIEKVLFQVPAASSIEVIGKLLNHQNSMIRQKAIEILLVDFTKLKDGETEFLYGNILPLLSEIICSSKELKSNRINALKCLQQLISAFGSLPQPSQAFIDALSKCLTCDQVAPDLSFSVMSTAVDKMGVRLITQVNLMLSLIKSNLLGETAASSHVFAAALGLCTVLVDKIPQFLSNFMPDLLRIVVKAPEVDEVENIVDLMDLMSVRVSPRHLLPAIYQFCGTKAQELPMNAYLAIQLLQKVIQQMGKADINSFCKAVFKFQLELFEYCCRRGDCDRLESETINSYLQLTLKLNDSMFKPLFLKLVDWGTAEALVERQLILFRIANNLLTNLKAVFSPYYVYLLEHSVALLNSTEHVERLWNECMSSLAQFFLFHSETLENAGSILPCLINQLNIDSETSLATDCLVNFAVLIVSDKDDALLKKLNHEILMKTRSDRERVRLNALNALLGLYDKLGDELLIHLPETVPFLSELLEDSSELVEATTRKLIKVIEGYLGESLQEHLK